MNRTQVPQVTESVEPDPGTLEPQTAGPDNRRRWPRYALPAQESFTVTADGRTGACTIEDISLGGARLRVAGDISRDLEIRIEHPLLGHATGRCRWRARGRLGVAFDHSERSLAFIADCMAGGIEVGGVTHAAGSMAIAQLDE